MSLSPIRPGQNLSYNSMQILRILYFALSSLLYVQVWTRNEKERWRTKALESNSIAKTNLIIHHSSSLHFCVRMNDEEQTPKMRKLTGFEALITNMYESLFLPLISIPPSYSPWMLYYQCSVIVYCFREWRIILWRLWIKSDSYVSFCYVVDGSF